MENLDDFLDELQYCLDGYNHMGHLLTDEQYRIMLSEAKAGNNRAKHLVYRSLKTYFLFMINTYGRQTLAKYHSFFDDLHTTSFRVFSKSLFNRLWTLCEGAVYSVLKNYNPENPKELPFTFCLGLEIKSFFENKLQNKLFETIAQLEEVETNQKELKQHEDVTKMLISQPSKLFLRFCQPRQDKFMLLHNILGFNVRRACYMSKVPFSDAAGYATLGIDELKKVVDMELENFPASFDELEPEKQIKVAHYYGYLDGNITIDEIKQRYEDTESYVYVLKKGLADLANNTLSKTYDAVNAEVDYESLSLQNSFIRMTKTNDLSERVKIIQQYSYEHGGILNMIDASRNFYPAVKQVFDEDLMLSEQLKTGVAKEYSDEEIRTKIGFMGDISYQLLQYKECKKANDAYINAHGGYKFLSDVYTQGLNDKIKFEIQKLLLDPYPPQSTLEEFYNLYGKYFSRNQCQQFLAEKIDVHISYLDKKIELFNRLGGAEVIAEKFLPMLTEVEKYIFLNNKIGAGHSYNKAIMEKFGIDEATFEEIKTSMKQKIEEFAATLAGNQNQPE